MNHAAFMQTALSLARRNLGQTWPNPSVGAIIVKNNQIIAQGATAPGGRPHAETQAIQQASTNAKGATLYVTLEPCAHHGKTPPCTETIITARIAQVVIACRDPNPQVNGKGIEQLRAAGIEVIEGIGTTEALELNRGFFSVIEKSRPLIALKIATSLDGKIAYPNATPRWLTGIRARDYGHLLRSRYDAIATGIGTVRADNPLLTCRLPGLEHRSPVRIIFDSRASLPPDSQLVKTAADTPLWLLTLPSSQRTPYPDSVRIIEPDTLDIQTAVTALAKQGITRLLIEGGARLTASFLQSGLVDRLYWFRAPVTIGENGLSVLRGNSLVSSRFTHLDTLPLGEDTLEIYDAHP